MKGQTPTATADKPERVKGVDQRGTKWRARWRLQGRPVYLGSYETKEEAEKAVMVARLGTLKEREIK